MINLDNVNWANYLAANPDVAASGMDPRAHWENHGQNEVGRMLGFQTVANQGQFYNQRDGTPIGPTNAAEMNAFANNNFTNHTGFDANTMAGTGGGITDPTIMNPDAVSFVQGGGDLGGGLGGLGGASYGRNAFDPAAFQSRMQDMFNNWQTQQQSQWDSMYDNLNQWGQMAYNGAGAANNGFQAGQPTNQSPVYNPNPGGGNPRNGFGGPLGNNNPWSPTF